MLISALICASSSAQTQYSIGSPSNEQQYMLELINRARANGAAEAARLGLSGLQEGPPRCGNETWTILNTAQPLSWNSQLANAAQNHATNLNNADHFFSGQDPHTFGGTNPEQRMMAAGYPLASYNGRTTPGNCYPGAENVAEEISQGSGPYTGAKLIASVLTAHNELFKDSNVPGRGHRTTTMLEWFREIGIGISAGADNGPGGTWDSLYIVQNFASQTSSLPFITGVAFRDTNGDGFYNPGEGIEGLRVDVTGSNFFAVTSSSGGYSVPVPGNGDYTVTFSGGNFATVQRSVSIPDGSNAKVDYVVTVLTAGSKTKLGNISTRAVVSTGDNVLIGGFFINGAQPKQVIVRAIGPSLPVAGRLSNPRLELYDSFGRLVGSNDNWRSTQEAEITATALKPSHDLEAALIATLPAYNYGYTVIVSGADGGSGIGLVEVYDLEPQQFPELANISSRGFVQTGDNVMIGGFIVSGNRPRRVIVRAIGPSLPVAGKLGDTTLELFDADGNLFGTNDNWRSEQEAEITSSGLAPTNDLEAAIVRPLTTGAYTAIVRGKNDASGIGLVEVYVLD